MLKGAINKGLNLGLFPKMGAFSIKKIPGCASKLIFHPLQYVHLSRLPFDADRERNT